MMKKIKDDMMYLIEKVRNSQSSEETNKLYKQIDLLKQQYKLIRECRKITNSCK